MPKVIAVVLHYENEKLTNQCVDSIHKTAPDVEILVVDNNSPTPYKREGKVLIYRNDNRQAVSGMNYGFLKALELEAEYIVNFDNDIVCLEGWLKPLLGVMEKDAKVGIVGGQQLTEDKTMFRSVGMDLVGGHLYGNWPKEEQEVTWIQGSAVMMRADMMRKIGVHDDRFKILCSDSDYCLHAKDRGWKVVFTPESRVIHIGGASYTSVCETWKQDNENLLWKWSGKAAMKMLDGFPIDSTKKQYLEVKYSVREDSVTK
jgi:GT2 family glycosyltransferase